MFGAAREARNQRRSDDAVEPEADEGDAPGGNPGDDGDDPFQGVVADGEIFQPHAAAQERAAV